MPSAHDQLVANDTGRWLDWCGEDVDVLEADEYPNGQWRSIKMFFPRESRAPSMSMQPRNMMNMFEGWIDARSNVTGLVNVTELRDGQDATWFRVGGKMYYVQRVLERNNCGMHHLQLFDGGVNENPV